MTKKTPELIAKILAEKGSMTTSGLAEKYGMSQSSIRRIIKKDGEQKDSGKEPVRLVVAEDSSVSKAEKKAEQKRLEPINLVTFSLTDKSQSQPTQNDEEMEIEKITTDDQPETEHFITSFVDDAVEEERMEEEREAEDDDDGTDKHYLFGRPSDKHAVLNKMAESEMDRQADEATDAVERLLGEDAEQTVKQSKSKPTPEEQQKRIEEEAEQRAKYLSRIYLNVINFSDHLPFIKNQERFLSSLHRKTTRELIALCGMIETQRSLGNVANQMKHTYFMFCRGAEIMSQRYARMKTQGFTDEMLKKERELNMIFQEIAIESADTLRAYTTPAMRLSLLTASTLMMIDNKNRMSEAKEQMDSKEVNPQISQQYGDL